MNEAKLLGKKIEYPQAYCPEILVAVPRHQNREKYGILQPGQLFCGYDCWHAYEASFILDNGMPVTGLLKIVYSADSPAIIESKSLKLYLASYNMTRMGATPDLAVSHFTQKIEEDLTLLLSTPVKACFFSAPPAQMPFDFSDYRNLETTLEPETVHFTRYQEEPAYLSENIRHKAGSLKICSHLLKSNCKITNQPDWGSIYIHLESNNLPDEAALLKYIVSLRNENHFHEEICEMVFKRLSDIFCPGLLMVACLYTRRGGIDICPVRANAPQHLPACLPQPYLLTTRTFRQ